MQLLYKVALFPLLVSSGSLLSPLRRPLGRSGFLYMFSSPSSSSSFNPPPEIQIPLEKLEFNFARSSGPGGQNVNKVNTKAEIRFNVQEADWLPEEVKSRLMQLQVNNMNKVGELVVSAQEHRTQKQNKELCLSKLREMVEEAYVEPKDRNMWTVCAI
jgi:protein subunit release factor B